MRKLALFLIFASALPAQKTPRPKLESPPRHWIASTGALTEPSGRAPREIAEAYLRSLAPAYGLSEADLAGIYIAKEYQSAHNGVTHLIFRQRFDGMEVQNAEWTVNIDANGSVLNAGGEFFRRPAQGLAAPDIASGARSLTAAVRSVNPSLGATSYLPQSASLPKGQKYMKFTRGGIGEEVEGKPVWYAVKGTLRPAWVFYVPEENGIGRQATIIDAASQRLLRSDSLTRYQSAPAPRGLVFERPSPQPNPQPGVASTAVRPYVERTLQPFTGDPAASPRGWVEGTQTIGNNVIAGHNPLGRGQLTTPEPASAPNRDFSFPLQLGPGAPNPANFKEAAITNLFYWTNKAHDLFYQSGFDEPSGNFQQDNLYRGGIGGDPMLAYAQFGSAAPARAQMDNAFFTTNRDGEDGARSSINMFISGSYGDRLFTDGSYDAEVILHEYTHGVSSRLVRNLWNFQGAAMSEAWSDFFGMEFTLPEGGSPDGVYPTGEYFIQTFGVGDRTRPYSTDTAVNPLTFRELGRVRATGPEEHADGEIWMEALWEARANLIHQFGEKEGRRRIRLLVLDGMKLAPPAPTMIDARDAILLADRVDFHGQSQDQLWTAFAKRGLGVLAQSNSADSVHIVASFEKPSKKAALRFYESTYNLGDVIRVALHDANNTSPTALVQLTASSGDIENVVVHKRGEVYYGDIQSWTDGFSARFDNGLDLVPGDYISAYYSDSDTGSGAQLIQTTVPTRPEYVYTPQFSSEPVVAGDESPLYPAALLGGPLPNQRITLPFAFPFFGESFRSVHVSGDGVLSFDIPKFSPCNDPWSFSATKAIAPMWTELAYGFAQDNENVYYGTGPGFVTFRWAAETPQTGDPVNVSVVLYEDGRILFQYGDGNVNLVNSADYGCSTRAPAVGISPGVESYSLRADGYNGSPVLQKALSVLLEPPFRQASDPVVRLESPAAGGTYKGVLTVKGIAYDDKTGVARLDLLIDGVPRRPLAPTGMRADFCAEQNVNGCPFVGFSSTLDFLMMGIAPGPHTIQVLATNNRGSFKRFPDQPVSITVEPGESRQPVGLIEKPSDAAALNGSTQIRGYVYAPDLRIRSVDILIDGVTYGTAAYGARRDDICGSLPNRPPNCPGVGFSYTLNSTAGQVQLPNGPHTLQARALDESGRFTLFPEHPVNITVDNPSNLPPAGVLTYPAPGAQLKGTLNITGYAYDPDGTVRSVDVIVDGSSYLRLRYGGERTEACAGLPAVKACPNIGFTGELDTTGLSNGLHTLGVIVRDSQGRSTILPSGTAQGLNVFVQN